MYIRMYSMRCLELSGFTDQMFIVTKINCIITLIIDSSLIIYNLKKNYTVFLEEPEPRDYQNKIKQEIKIIRSLY